MPSKPWGQWTGQIPAPASTSNNNNVQVYEVNRVMAWILQFLSRSVTAPAPAPAEAPEGTVLYNGGYIRIPGWNYAVDRDGNPYWFESRAAPVNGLWPYPYAIQAAAAEESEESDEESEEEEESEADQLYSNDQIDPTQGGYGAGPTPRNREPGLGLHGITLWLPEETNYLFPKDHVLMHIVPEYADPTAASSLPEWYARYWTFAQKMANGGVACRRYCVPITMTVRDVMEQLLVADGSSEAKKNAGFKGLIRTPKPNGAEGYTWEKKGDIRWKDDRAKKSIKVVGLHKALDGTPQVFLLCVGQSAST